MKPIALFVVAFFAAVSLQSCCEPEFKDSHPEVLFDSYRDSAVYDRMPASHVTDSGYYPIWEFAIKNTGSDADTFDVALGVDGYGFHMKRFVAGGETVIFRTPGPVPDTADTRAQDYYYTMFRRDTNELPIQVMKPVMFITYGEVFKGDEGCNTAPSRMDIDTRLFR